MDDKNSNYPENNTNEEERSDTQDMVATNLNGQQLYPTEIGNSKDDEEIAAEMTADNVKEPIESNDEPGKQVNSAFGWTALSLSIISFFIMPIILGGAGVILGLISKKRGADTLGNTAIVAGAISILISLFVLPFV